MYRRRFANRVLSSLPILALSGCSFLSLLGPSSASTPAPIQLVRCATAPAAVCLQSFGLGQGQLLITFNFPAAGSASFYLKVWSQGVATTYPCTTAETSASIMYCTGPLIDLGTPVKIELYTKAGSMPLAAGEFTVNDLAVPTPPIGVELTLTAAPTPTALGVGTAYPNPPHP